MERQIKLKNLTIIMLLAFILCLGMAIMTDQVFAQGSMATINANGTICEVNDSEQWEEALEVIDDLSQDTWAEITLHSDISARVPELDKYRIKMTINLNGHTWTINDDTSMQTRSRITINGDGGTITIADGVYPSGLFCVYGSKELVVENTNFVDCNCGKYPLFYLVGSSSDHAHIFFENCHFDGCSSTAYGGVIYGYYTSSIALNCCTFNSCHSKYGGVFYIEDSMYDGAPSSCTCDGSCEYGKSSFTNCSADYGGLAYLDCSGFDLGENIDIESCSAKRGGAIYCDKNSAFVLSSYIDNIPSEVVVSYCTADECGGFCYSEGRFIITGGNGIRLTIHDCSAPKGGMLYMGDNSKAEIGRVRIYDCNADLGSIVYCDSYDNSEFLLESGEFTDSKQSYKDGELIYCENAILKAYSRVKVFTDNSHTIYNGGSFNVEGIEMISLDGKPLGSFLSGGSLWIIVSVAVAALVAVAVVINKKKKGTTV